MANDIPAATLLEDDYVVSPLRRHALPPITDGCAGSPSTVTAADVAGVADGPVDVAELHAPYAHQEIILKEALGLDDGVAINPSGGALAANPIMSAGLIRIGEAATRIASGQANRAVAHATSGPCLQQNLVCVLEGE